jgi:hypothetical protein
MPGIQPKRPKTSTLVVPCCLPVDLIPLVSTALQHSELEPHDGGTSVAFTETFPTIFLATKLHVPQSRPGFVSRPRLADRPAPAHGGELTLVYAPAGFGKTAPGGRLGPARPAPLGGQGLNLGI